MKLLKRIWSVKIDILIILLSIACFALFIHRALRGPEMSGVGGRVGKVVDGSMQRKRTGAVLFTRVGGGEALYHMDALWTGALETVNIEIEPAVHITLHPNTFLILRRHLGSKDLSSLLQVVKGKVDVSRKESVLSPKRQRMRIEVEEAGQAPKTEKLAEKAEPPSKPEPQAEPEPEPEKPEEPKFYPANDTTFYLAGKQEPITLSWTTKITGSVVVKDATGKLISTLPVEDNSFARATLANQQSYTWTVFDKDQKPLYGPFSFRMALEGEIDLKGALKALEEGKPNKEIIMSTDRPQTSAQSPAKIKSKPKPQKTQPARSPRKK